MALLATQIGLAIYKGMATWPEELTTPNKQSHKCNGDLCNRRTAAQSWAAFGVLMVTAGVGGEIKTYQDFGFPIHSENC